jgi:hypothetical protein
VDVTNFNKDGAVSAVLALLRRLWPFAALAVAVLVNVLWIGVLVYAVIRLLVGLR